MKFRIKLLFEDGREPLFSLVRLSKPSEEDISRGMKKHGADGYEVIEI